MDGSTVDLITKLIGNLGFPIFVAVWLLWRTDSLLQQLLATMKEIQDEIKSAHGGGST